MKYARELAALMAFAAVSLVAVAGSVAVLFAVLEHFTPTELWGLSGAFRTGFFATLVFGTVPAVLVGGPAYWLIRRCGCASWLNAVAIGGVLGTLVAVVEPALTAWGVGCGGIVAGLTHLAATRWLGPNKSSKPTPLRGSA
jgi:hypothetical protein